MSWIRDMLLHNSYASVYAASARPVICQAVDTSQSQACCWLCTHTTNAFSDRAVYAMICLYSGSGLVQRPLGIVMKSWIKILI